MTSETNGSGSSDASGAGADDSVLVWLERVAQLSVAGWGAALIVLVTLTEESWIGKLLLAIHDQDGSDPGLLGAIGGYVATASAGLLASAFFLIAETRTRTGWAGVASLFSFALLAIMLGLLFIHGADPPDR